MCQILGVELFPARTTRFSNDCLQVQLRANCRQRDVYVVQSLVPPVQENLFELLLMLDAARGASAAHITAVIPHFAYARSDKKDAPRISIGGPAGRRHAVHRRGDPGADHGAARAAGARLLLGPGRPPERDQRAGRPLPPRRPEPTPWSSHPTWATPRWPPRSPGSSDCRWPPARSSGWPTTGWSSTGSSATSSGRDVIVLDDEIATAGSIIELLRKLREEGARDGSRSPAPTACSPVRRSSGSRTRPTSPRSSPPTRCRSPPEKQLPNIVTRSVAPLFAEAVHRIHVGESISSLFSAEETYG